MGGGKGQTIRQGLFRYQSVRIQEEDVFACGLPDCLVVCPSKSDVPGIGDDADRCGAGDSGKALAQIVNGTILRGIVHDEDFRGHSGRNG